MKKLYMLSKQLTIAAIVSFTLFSNSSSAQCGPIVEDFNNTSGSTAGFTGPFVLGSQSGNGFLQKSNSVRTTTYTITTPTYKLSNVANTIQFGFILSGSVAVATAVVRVSYVSTITGQIENASFGSYVPGYTGTGNNRTATLCQSAGLTQIPGFPTGGSYRFIIDLTANEGNGGSNDNIVFDDFRTNGTLAQAALPVAFMGFDAKKVPNGIQVTWKVAGEENVRHYEVERSTDGRNFTSLATVSTDKTNTYNYLDATSTGTVYYRIKNVDTDGKFKYSSIARLVNGKSEIVLKAFPQPVSNQLTIQHPNIKDNTLVTVSTADGRLIKSIRPTLGSMQTFVDMSAFKSGLYLVRFDAGDGAVETMKVVKQ